MSIHSALKPSAAAPAAAARRSAVEIARELGTPLGTVLTRMRLALGKLRNRLNSKDVR